MLESAAWRYLIKGKGGVCMAPISNKDLSVFKDLCGMHSNFTATQASAHH